MRRLLGAALLLAAVAALGGWILTAPGGLPEDDLAALAALSGDAERGERVFWAGGCASCHAAPEAEGEARLELAGGVRFETPFGTFIAPNISPDPAAGIGGWTLAEFATALRHGVSPEGRHYYPAFPYTSYAHASLQDIADLWAYLGTLPPSGTASADHDVGFPFSIRRGLGVWKLLNMPDGFVVAGDLPERQERGRYLVEALGHCGECHTPRDGLGGLDRSAWLQGAPNPDGDGRIPGITPGQLGWSDEEIAAYLRDGFTPEFDVAAGSMADVVLNTGRLPDEDRRAIAAYLVALPEGAPAE